MNVKSIVQVVALGMAASLSAAAQPMAGQVSVTVDVDFYVGGVRLEAGKYTIGPVRTGAVRITSLDTKASVVSLANPIYTSNFERANAIMLTRRGDRYFLAQIWFGDGNGVRLLPSRLKREYASAD